MNVLGYTTAAKVFGWIAMGAGIAAATPSLIIKNFALTAEKTTPMWQRILGGISAVGAISNSFSGGKNNKDSPKNCLDFVNEVANVLSKFPYAIATRFVNKLYERFGKRTSEFGSDGFKKEFQDDNQARHYVGGLWAGFQLGASAGLVAANLREVNLGSIPVGLLSIPVVLPQTASQKADSALNGISTKHGGGLADGTIKTYELAFLIRKEMA